MTVKLEIEFSGLCNFLIQKNSEAVGIVMPDGRSRGRLVKPYDYPACKKHLVHHVGYLRYDLADRADYLDGQTPEDVDAEHVEAESDDDDCATVKDGPPAYEVVHRFDFEELHVGTAEVHQNGMQTELIGAADLRYIDPFASIRPGLFSARPHKRLLMRMILRGGTFQAPPVRGTWYFDDTLLPSGEKPYSTWLSGTAIWAGTLSGDQVTVRLRSWRHGGKTTIRLRPAAKDGVVRLKIANLCDRNPMEWPELNPRVFDATADEDFKWFYFLWKDVRGEFDELLTGTPPKLLPVPHPDPIHGDIYNCGRAAIFVDKIGE